ncbi:XrtY-associated glycosyltransferase XYAG1 [Arcticibacter sp. MXS-1]|uniref:XrtY-associated glycosyltransferase XYAG1 n=1 Tax=Arcticibacter sp. MXS-1 TaxID=3341726 RepID=UPI0035A972AF
MKILFIIPSYKPATIYGGTITVSARLAETLALKGHSVTVYTTTANGNKELPVDSDSPIVVEGVIVRYFKRVTGDHTHISPDLLSATWRTVRDFDAVHLHSWWNPLIIAATWVCKRRGVKPVLSPHGMLCDYIFGKKKTVKALIHSTIGKRLLRHTLLHVSSEAEWKESVRVNPTWQGQTIFNLVDLADKTFSRTSNKVFTIGFLSRIDAKKGLDILIKALSLVEFNFALKIAGSGDEEYVNELKILARDCGIETKLDWLGWKKGDERFEFLASCDLFALTSHNENFAVVVVESLNVGTPVLLSKHVGLSAYVQKRGLGWETDIANIKNVAASLRDAYNASKNRAEIEKKSKETIERDFDPSFLAEQYISFYKKTL